MIEVCSSKQRNLPALGLNWTILLLSNDYIGASILFYRQLHGKINTTENIQLTVCMLLWIKAKCKQMRSKKIILCFFFLRAVSVICSREHFTPDLFPCRHFNSSQVAGSPLNGIEPSLIRLCFLCCDKSKCQLWNLSQFPREAEKFLQWAWRNCWRLTGEKEDE